MTPKQRNLSIVCCCCLLGTSTFFHFRPWVNRSTLDMLVLRASTDEGAAAMHRAPDGLSFLESTRKGVKRLFTNFTLSH
jgi:hypothetical protein